jgi:hypothetical protein
VIIAISERLEPSQNLIEPSQNLNVEHRRALNGAE